MYWPSFNGALATNDGQLRAMVNTVLSLSACCVTAFFVDNLIRPEHKVVAYGERGSGHTFVGWWVSQ